LADVQRRVRSILWERLSRCGDDPAERADGLASAAAMIATCERVGLLAQDELAQWRRLIENAGEPQRVTGDRRAADRHLERLLRDVKPMTRERDPAQPAATRRFHAALDALYDVGVLDAETKRRWWRRATSARAPWLDENELDELSHGSGQFLLTVPPASAEEAEGLVTAAEEWERLLLRGTARRVFVADGIERDDGLAVVAVVTRSEVTEVIFHHVGGPTGELADGFAELEPFRDLTESFLPPRLTDNLGTHYTPVADHPVYSRGVGGIPDPERLRVITGGWRYQPPAPDEATAFELRAPDARWRLTM
jgi:hypothetical protein